MEYVNKNKVVSAVLINSAADASRAYDECKFIQYVTIVRVKKESEDYAIFDSDSMSVVNFGNWLVWSD